ncbi:MAG: hypothetical protein ACRD50_00145 [Candidatus Acidiferrales bacterium]
MTPSWIFISGLGTALFVSLIVIAYLQAPLKSMLVDLCGTEARANFWKAFSNVAIFLTPLIFALHHPDASQDESALFTLASQLERALAGLITAVLILGFVLAMFIPRGHAEAPRTETPSRSHT